MGTFYEAFGIIKIKARSSKAKCAKKAVNKRFERPTKPPNNSPPIFNSKPTSSKKKIVKKKPVVLLQMWQTGPQRISKQN